MARLIGLGAHPRGLSLTGAVLGPWLGFNPSRDNLLGTPFLRLNSIATQTYSLTMAIPTTSSRRPLRAAVLLLAVAAALLLLTAPHASAAAGGLPGGLLPPPLLAAQSHDSILGSSTSGEGGSSSSGSSMGRQLQQAGYTVTGSVKTARRSFSYKAARQGLRHGRRSQQ